MALGLVALGLVALGLVALGLLADRRSESAVVLKRSFPSAFHPRPDLGGSRLQRPRVAAQVTDVRTV